MIQEGVDARKPFDKRSELEESISSAVNMDAGSKIVEQFVSYYSLLEVPGQTVQDVIGTEINKRKPLLKAISNTPDVISKNMSLLLGPYVAVVALALLTLGYAYKPADLPLWQFSSVHPSFDLGNPKFDYTTKFHEVFDSVFEKGCKGLGLDAEFKKQAKECCISIGEARAITTLFLTPASNDMESLGSM